MAYDRSKHDDAGRPIGSPNDPTIGKARDQNTGPGGKGLVKRQPQAPKEENSERGKVGQGT